MSHNMIANNISKLREAAREDLETELDSDVAVAAINLLEVALTSLVDIATSLKRIANNMEKGDPL